MNDELAKRVRAARSYAGITQEDMAHRLGISLVTYKRLEQGKRKVSLDEIKRIAEITQMPAQFFSVDLEQLADGSEHAQNLQRIQENIEGLVNRLADLEYRMRQNQG